MISLCEMSFIFIQVKGLLAGFLQMKPTKSPKLRNKAENLFEGGWLIIAAQLQSSHEGSATHHSDEGRCQLKGSQAGRTHMGNEVSLSFYLPNRHNLANESMLG